VTSVRNTVQGGWKVIQLERTQSRRFNESFGKRADGVGRGNVFHVRFDPDVESIVHVVVTSVAAIRNVDPLELEPLNESIDPETLANVVRPRPEQAIRGASITFHYEGLNITIETDGDLWLEWE